MNRQDIKQLLLDYELQLDDDVDQAMKCQNSPQKWQSYMKDWIPQAKHSQFKDKLYELHILQNKDNLLKNVQSFQSKFFRKISKVQIKINNIYVSSIKEFRWTQKLMEQIRIETKTNIETNIVFSNSLSDFLKKQIFFILDILFRKASLRQYFDQIKMANNSFNQKYPLFTLFNEMTFLDFVIALIKFSANKGVIGRLISQQRIPVPIIYQANQQFQFNQELILDILGMQSYSLIFNIGTPKTSKCGKTSLMAKIFSLNEQNITATHLHNTVNFYSGVNFCERGKSVLLDLNGSFSEQTYPRLLKIIQSYANFVSLLIIHIHQYQIKQKFLHQKVYQYMLNCAQKIIIFVRDIQSSTEKVLLRFIPQQIKEKSLLVCLPNLEKQSNTKYKQLLIKMLQQSFNVFSENKFSYVKFCQNSSKQEFYKYQKMVTKAMDIIDVKSYNKRTIIPNLCKIEQLSELQVKIQQQNKSQVLISQYKQKQSKLKRSLVSPRLSQFIKQCIEIIQISPLCKQMLAEKLQNWKNSNNNPLRQQFLNLSHLLYQKKGEPNQIKKRLALNEELRSHFQITIDKIINELVLYNQAAKDAKYTKIITEFYRKSLEEISPINIIDGKTLSFGNNAIKEIISVISNQYSKKKKKIYVVSVIGAQSSAKSTLLNFLFRCKFETSAGRCTKGIYMSLIEVEDMVLVVLDTEGLLSVSARDTAFDHQIASFILKISNLIIINNKGELTSTLQQMLQVCLYVLQCLHKDEKQIEYHPQKIIFALRDQATSSEQIQKEEAAKIKNSLEEIRSKSSFDYSNFFTIQTNDIFSFPSAFIELLGLIPKVGSIKTYDQQIFGKCILGLRNRMINQLKSIPSQKTLKQFYEQASRTWKAIQTSGKDIMNFKTFNEITVKKSIQQRYNNLSYTYMNQMQTKYQQFFNMIKEIKKPQQILSSEYRSRLKQIRSQMFNKITQDFTNHCKEICSNEEWIKQFYPKIERICMCYETSYLQQFDRKIANIIQREKDQELTKKLNRIISNLLGENGSEQQILTKFKDDMIKIMNQIKKQRQINKDKLWLQIMNVFQTILSLGKYSQLKIYHIEDCYRIYYQILCEKNISKRVSQLFRFDHNYLRQNKDELFLNETFNNLLKSFENKIKKLINKSKIKSPVDIYENRQLFLVEINNYIFHFYESIKILNQKNWIMEVFLYLPIHKIILFGKLYENMKEQVYFAKLQNNQKQLAEISNKMSIYESNLIRMLNMRGNAKQIIENDIKNFVRQLKDDSKRQCKEIIQNQIGKLALRLTPESIFSKAMNQTLLSSFQTNKKNHYINCFKMVKNINRYLYEIMCESPQIATRSNTIVSAIEITLTNVQITINQLKNVLSKIRAKQDEFDIRQSLNDCNMVGTANFQNQNISLKQITENLLKSLEKDSTSYINQIKDLLNNSHLEDQTLRFIEGSLRDKIIGCQSICPMCNMKCMLNKGHKQNHKVLENCHSLSAFAGCHFIANDEPIVSLCREKNNVIRKWHHHKSDISPDLKSHIIKHYPDWQSDFPNLNEEHNFQTFADKARLHKIWANIENVLIRTKHTNLKYSTEKEIKLLKDSQELNMNDLQTQYEERLTKKKYQLKNY